MPWGGKIHTICKKKAKKKTLNQGTYKKESLGCNNCPHRPKQISTSQEAMTGKLSRILLIWEDSRKNYQKKELVLDQTGTIIMQKHVVI